MSATSIKLSLPLIQPSQAQKHVTHNEALRVLDVLVQAVVLDHQLTEPPASPMTGDSYVIAPGATGDWASREGQIATQDAGFWTFLSPMVGWSVHSRVTGETLTFNGAGWSAEADRAQNAASMGVNTSADSVNRLAVASEATLLTHAGAGHQVKINKAAATDTASLLFQTGWLGRAEMGTAGSDDFAIKVSADGSNFATAVTIDGAAAIPAFPQGLECLGPITGNAVQQSPDDTSAGRLMRADWGYGPGNLVGTVSESAGVPTGAVIESGATADGEYTRWADGSQMCTGSVTLAYEDASKLSATWNFPAPFAIAPAAVSGTLDADSAIATASLAPDAYGTVQHSSTGSSQTKINQYRIPGTTDFAVGDSAVFRAIALGRWY